MGDGRDDVKRTIIAVRMSSRYVRDGASNKQRLPRRRGQWTRVYHLVDLAAAPPCDFGTHNLDRNETFWYTEDKVLALATVCELRFMLVLYTSLLLYFG